MLLSYEVAQGRGVGGCGIVVMLMIEAKAAPLHVMQATRRKVGIAPTHS
jgi:hypothetical protein